MDYKKITKDNYNMHFINTNRFKTISIEVNFTKNLEEDNISYYKYLSRLIAYSNKKYDTRKKMSIHQEELYGSTLYASSTVIGNMENFLVGVDFINPKYTESSELKNNLDLLFTSIKEPNIKNDAFDKKVFESIKNSLITNFKIREEYPGSVAYRRFEKIMFKGSPASFDNAGKLEIIEKLNEKDLYKFYKKLYKGYSINILVYGDIDKNTEEYIVSEFDKNFKEFTGVKSDNFSPFIKRRMNKDKEESVEEKKNVTQSTLIMGYDVDIPDIKKYQYALNLYNMILGGSANSLLFIKVREDNSFCYTVGSGLYKYSKALVITAGINRKNYKDCKRVIKECITLMNKRQTIEENIEKVKKTMNTKLNDYYDSATAISDHYFINEFDKEDDIELSRKKYNDVTVDEILEINKFLKLRTVYFLEGTNEDE